MDVQPTLASVAVAALFFSSLQPALADVSFEQAQRLRGELLNVSANSLTSTDGVIPYTFYELPYCVPDAEVQPLVSNLGTALSGSVLLSSPYTFTVGKDETCTQLCEGILDADSLTKFQHFIRRSYRGNLVVDGLPAVRPDNVKDTACKIDRGRRLYSDVRGFAVGSCETTTGGGVEYQINNHLSFTVKYANHTDKHGRETLFVVGFLVEPQSYAESGCRGGRLSAGDAESRRVHYTYSVKWEHAPTAWERRWDYYLRSAVNEDNNVGEHWLKLTQSLLVLLCLSFVVALILMRTLHVDFNRYNNPDNEDELQEEVGWKLVHGDVFRPPAYPHVFSAFIGTGTQILGLLIFSVVFSLTGIVAPSHRGRLVMALIFLFVLLSFVNGYVMGRMQTMLAVRMWKAVLLSGMAFPGFLYSLWIITEVHLTSRNAANAVSLRTAASLFALWVGVCLPQTVLGASFAYRQDPVTSPIPYTKHERPVPPQRWFLSTPVLLFGGIIPFGAAHWELVLIMRAVWQGQVVHLFAFVALSMLAVAIALCETVLVVVYYQLVCEDHRWWWKSLVVPTGMSLLYLAFAIHYYFTVLMIRTWLAAWMYGCFCLVFTVAMALAAGTVSFFSAWCFVKKIYTSIKID